VALAVGAGEADVEPVLADAVPQRLLAVGVVLEERRARDRSTAVDARAELLVLPFAVVGLGERRRGGQQGIDVGEPRGVLALEVVRGHVLQPRRSPAGPTGGAVSA